MMISFVALALLCFCRVLSYQNCSPLASSACPISCGGNQWCCYDAKTTCLCENDEELCLRRCASGDYCENCDEKKSTCMSALNAYSAKQPEVSAAKSRFGTAFAGGLPTYTGSLELDDLSQDCKQQACDCSSGTCVCTGAKILAEVEGAVIVQTTSGANNVVTCLDSTSSSARAPPVGSAAKSQYDFPFPGSSAKSQYDFPFPGSSAKSFRDSYSAKGQYDFPFPGSSAKSQYDQDGWVYEDEDASPFQVVDAPISVGWYWVGGLIAAMLACIAGLLCFAVCIRPFVRTTQSTPNKYAYEV